jgi:hypothetical protein
MTRDELLDAFEVGCDKIRTALVGIPEEAYEYKPSPDAWSIKEIIHHLPDSEASGYIRCRKIIAESGVTVSTYDQVRWTDRLKYQTRDIGGALELFSLMRSYTATLLRSVDDTIWQNNYVLHPEDGKMTLLRWLNIYVNHIDKHAEQIKRNLRFWEEAGRP